MHWTVAALVVWLFWSGQLLEHAAALAEKQAQLLSHSSIGILSILAALLRTALRFVNGMPARPKQSIVLDALAAAVPWILLVMVLGAGVIHGWTASGSRPRFTIVNGVSAGALIAPSSALNTIRNSPKPLPVALPNTWVIPGAY